MDGTSTQIEPRSIAIELAGPRPSSASTDTIQAPSIAGANLKSRPRHFRDRPLRILWYERSFGLGGSQLRLKEMIEHLSTDGAFDSTVVAPGDGPLQSALTALGASVHSIPPLSLDDPVAYETTVSELDRMGAEPLRHHCRLDAHVVSWRRRRHPFAPAGDLAGRRGQAPTNSRPLARTRVTSSNRTSGPAGGRATHPWCCATRWPPANLSPARDSPADGSSSPPALTPRRPDPMYRT